MDSAEETARHAGSERRADIGGDAHGPVVAGDHNLVIAAGSGATVTVRPVRARPRPVRRERIALPPRRIPAPVGRRAELAALADALRSGPGLVQLWGPPGTGKGTLLRHAARVLEPGPDGTVFLNAARAEPRDLAQQLFEACYDAPGYAPTATELRRLLAGLRVTVYLDRLALTAGRLAELTDAAPDATFVFTGAERSVWHEGTALEVTGLDEPAGLELLARGLDRPLRDGERPAAVELWRAAGGRPELLLRAAALARTRAHGTARLPRPGEVAALIPALLDQLGTAESRTLHLLATLGEAELAPGLLGTLAGIPDPAALGDRLADLGLVRVGEGGYRCAADAVPLVRERNRVPYPADRLCGMLTEWALRPETTAAEVAAHGQALEAAAELAALCGQDEPAVRLAEAVAPALAGSLRFGVWGRLLGHGWSAARRTRNVRAEANFTHQAAIRALVVGQLVAGAALLARALLLWREVGDAAGVEAALEAQPYLTPGAPGGPEGPGGSEGPGGPGGPEDPGGPGAADGPGGPEAAAPPDGSGAVPGPEPVGAPGADAGSGVDGGSGAAGPVDPGFAVPADGGGPGGFDVAAHMAELCGETLAAQAPAAGAATTAGAGAGTAPASTAWAGSAGTGPGLASSGAGAGAGAGVGAGAGAGAAALQGGWLLALGIGAVLTVVAVVVGAVALSQRDSADPRYVSGESVSRDDGGSDGSAADDGGERDGPVNTDLAGVWMDGLGTEVEFTATGPGSYHARVPTDCGPVDIELSGDDGRYSGTQTVYEYNMEDGSCLGTGVVGHLLMTVQVQEDGRRARVEKKSAPGQPSCAYSCEPAMLIRK